jgi:hypothetical protein
VVVPVKRPKKDDKKNGAENKVENKDGPVSKEPASKPLPAPPQIELRDEF